MAETKAKTTKKTVVKKTVAKKPAVKKVAAKKVVAPKAEEKKAEIALNPAVWQVAYNADLVAQVLYIQQSNARLGTAKAKTRAEVRGGGIKPWKQKGTGRARHGSIRSPLWVGGGVAHGPRNDKNFDRKINKKMKAKALYTILSKKFADGEVLFIDSISIDKPKTKDAKEIIS